MKPVLVVLFLALTNTVAFTKDNSMKRTLSDEIKLTAETKTVKVLSAPSFKVIGLGFKKGQKLEKHLSPTPAVLIIHSGSVLFIMNGKTHSLVAGDFFDIPPEVEHEVVGKEDSLLYLIK